MGKINNISPYLWPGLVIDKDVVIKRVCRLYGIESDTLYIHTKKRTVVEPRQLAMYLMRRDLKMTLKTISGEFGIRQHGTVKNAIKTIENLIETNDLFRNNIKDLL